MSSDRLPLHETSEKWWASALPIAFAILATLPVLIIPYLPMADLPQHFANLSILCNINDPSYGFSEFYELDFTKTLYILPYLIGWGLSFFIPIEIALRCVVFLSLIVIPLGLLNFLRAQGKPALFALLGIPFVFNIATFGGFINFNLALGMAFFAYTLFSKERPSLASEIGLSVLCLLLSITHLYGTALIMGYAVLWGLFGEGKNTFRRYLPLAPCLVGVVFWGLMWHKAYGIHEVQWMPVKYKFTHLQNAVLGGYKDWSETWILSGFCAIVFLFALYGFWLNRKDLARFLRADRIFYIYIILNFFAYLVLPTNIPTAKFIYIRHSIIVFCFLPLITPPDFLRKVPIIAIPLLVCLALASIGNSWYHLLRFDNEAYSFDHIIELTPRRARMIQITLDFQGQVMKTAPYIHFLAYAQGKKGGFIATSFAMYAWLAPIKKKDNVEIPIIPVGFEWSPIAYDYYDFGYYYNYVIIRGYNPLTEKILKTLPYVLVYEEPPWRLYQSYQ